MVILICIIYAIINELYYVYDFLTIWMKKYQLLGHHFEIGDNISSGFPQNVTIHFNTITFNYPCDNEVECGPYYIYLPKGVYKFEVWGAQGGIAISNSNTKPGGYSKGTLTTQRSELIYIFVGGRGASKYGGYNGGGTVSSENRFGDGGGGATDIRVGGYTYNHRILVAGGSGGKEFGINEAAGYGGGIQGSNGNGYISNRGGKGGTQISGGSQNSGFGYGGNSTLEDTGGGGGGWYGGAAGDYEGDGRGGSGFVYNSTNKENVPDGYQISDDYFLLDGDTVSGEYWPDNTNYIDFKPYYYGNGIARITILSIKNEICTFSFYQLNLLLSNIYYQRIILKYTIHC